MAESDDDDYTGLTPDERREYVEAKKRNQDLNEAADRRAIGGQRRQAKLADPNSEYVRRIEAAYDLREANALRAKTGWDVLVEEHETAALGQVPDDAYLKDVRRLVESVIGNERKIEDLQAEEQTLRAKLNAQYPNGKPVAKVGGYDSDDDDAFYAFHEREKNYRKMVNAIRVTLSKLETARLALNKANTKLDAKRQAWIEAHLKDEASTPVRPPKPSTKPSTKRSILATKRGAEHATGSDKVAPVTSKHQRVEVGGGPSVVGGQAVGGDGRPVDDGKFLLEKLNLKY
jgi:hypothetical protein